MAEETEKKTLEDLCGELEDVLDSTDIVWTREALFNLGPPSQVPDLQEIHKYVGKYSECDALFPLSEFDDSRCLCLSLPSQTENGKLEKFLQTHRISAHIKYQHSDDGTQLAIMEFDSHEALMKVLKLQGRWYPAFFDEKLYFDRILSTSVCAFLVYGFKNLPIEKEKMLKSSLSRQLQRYGSITRMYLPKEDSKFKG